MIRWTICAALGAVAIIALTGCTALRGDSDEPDAGQAPGNLMVNPDWACLGDGGAIVPVPRQPVAGQRVTYIVAIVDFDSQPTAPTVVDKLSITVCTSENCDQPFTDVGIKKPFLPSKPFVYAIDVPYQLSAGYLKLIAPGYVEMDYVFGGPMIGPPEGGFTVLGLAIPLLKTGTRDGIYHDLGFPVGPADPTRGVLAVRTLNCKRGADPMSPQGSRAEGVQLEALSTPMGAVAWTLSFDNIATPNKLQTDSRGVAGFVNVLPGALDVRGIAPVDGVAGVRYGNTTLRVHPGVITLAEVRQGLGQWGQ